MWTIVLKVSRFPKPQRDPSRKRARQCSQVPHLRGRARSVRIIRTTIPIRAINNTRRMIIEPSAGSPIVPYTSGRFDTTPRYGTRRHSRPSEPCLSRPLCPGDGRGRCFEVDLGGTTMAEVHDHGAEPPLAHCARWPSRLPEGGLASIQDVGRGAGLGSCERGQSCVQ